MRTLRATVCAFALLAGGAVPVAAQGLPGAKVPALLQKVEAQRGQPLTFEQRQQFARVAANLRDALLPAQQQFVRAVAQTFKLAEREVESMLPAIGADKLGFDNNIIPQIEARRGRAISPQELQQIRAADNSKKAEMSEIQSRYAAELARIAGLSKDQIQRMLPTIGI